VRTGCDSFAGWTPAPAGPGRRGGITLIETVLCTLVVAVMLVAALRMLGSAAVADRQHWSGRLRPAVAGQLMAEVLANSYVDTGDSPVFGPETGESGTDRSNFDDVDDYNGWSSSPPEGRDGTAIAGLTGWTREVTVAWADPADVETTSVSDQGLKRITVTVTDAQGRSAMITALRGSDSSYDYEPGSSTTYVSWVGVTLKVGPADQARMTSGANPLNCVPSLGGS